jgi:ABC-type glutathione transport system ATPase component
MTGGQVLRLLRAGVERDGVTILLVTHDPAAAAWSDRLVLLRDGAVVADGPTPDAAGTATRLREATADSAGWTAQRDTGTGSPAAARAASTGPRGGERGEGVRKVGPAS